METFKRIIVWLGIMAGLTVVALGVWWLIWSGSQSTGSLKWLQFLQTTAMFLVPPILCAKLWDKNHQAVSWLKLNKGANVEVICMAIALMICAVPGINLLSDLNSKIQLPECLDSIEQILKQQEAAAAALTERFLKADSGWEVLLNIGLMALLPAFAEEFTFRGTLQQILSNSPKDGLTAKNEVNRALVAKKRSSMAIWITAIVFSAIHMQFYGFIPRMLMGAMFGYVFVWTGSIWIPVLMHFTNNCMAVVAYSILEHSEKNIADTFGAGDTWGIGAISLVITCLGLLIFYRRTRTQ